MYVSLKLIELAIIEMKNSKKRQPTRSELDKYFSECGGIWKKADTTTSWCGIFATYLLRKAGAKVLWSIGYGIHNQTGNENPEGEIFVQYVKGNQGITLGDIAVRGSGNHHFIVVGSPDSNGVFDCVEGNYGGIGDPWLHYGKNYKNNISAVKHYYRVF